MATIEQVKSLMRSHFELGLPLYVIQLDKLITKYMGETSEKLRQVFEFIYEVNAVYLFDEFDAIGWDREY